MKDFSYLTVLPLHLDNRACFMSSFSDITGHNKNGVVEKIKWNCWAG